MSVTIQLRRDTAANWTSVNPILFQGEMGVETDTLKAKLGDGVTHWSSLAYWSGSGGGGFSNPMTTLGDLIYENGTPAAARLAGDTSNNRKFLRTQATGGVAQAPAWDSLQAGDVPQLADYAPTGLTGATAVTRYVGGTASGAPVSGTFAVGDFIIDQSGAVWVCTTAGTPGTWTRAGTAIDGTATDIQPIGVQAAGSIGKAADAGHVHPFEPWQFQPETYGAKADGKVIVDATIAAGALSTLTSATAGFTSADTGKHIVVSQAGGSATTPLFTTITFVNSTTVTLGSAASAGGVTNVGAIYGTDDTAAIQSAVNAAVTYAQAHVSQFAEVLFWPAYYMVAGNPLTTVSGNAQITLPIVSASSGYKVNLKLTGIANVTAPPEHWLQVTQNAPGSVLVCANGTGTYNATNGPSCVIGGPVNGYGGGGGTYSNMCLTVDGLTCLLPYTTTIGGMNLFGVGQMKIKGLSVMPMATAAASTPWPQLASEGPTSNFFPSGLIIPASGNNAVADIDVYTCYGQHTGLAGTDHLRWNTLITIYCNNGWLATNQQSNAAHTATGLSWCCEQTGNPMIVATGATWPGYNTVGPVRVNVASISLETYTAYLMQGDSSGLVSGQVYFEADSATNVNYYSVQADVLSVKLISLENLPGPVASPHAPPSSTGVWNNYYYRDAEITLSVSAGTLSALSINSTAQTIPASTTFYRFTLPSGHSYKPTFTGTLTHTVTLL
jgi:hypothetical protein